MGIEIEHEYRNRKGDGVDDTRRARRADRVEIGKTPTEGGHRRVELGVARMRLRFLQEVRQVGKSAHYDTLNYSSYEPETPVDDIGTACTAPMLVCSIETLQVPAVIKRFAI